MASHTDSEYEWVQHVGIAAALGIKDEQISAVQLDDFQANCLDTDAQVLLRYTSEVLQGRRAEQTTFTALKDRFPPRQIVELLLVIGIYQMLAHLMTNLDIDLDPAAGTTVIDRAIEHLGS